MDNSNLNFNCSTATVASSLDFNCSTATNTSDYYYTTGTIPDYYTYATQKIEEPETSKEKKEMFNFDFGFITDDSIRMSPYGMAIKNQSNKYVSYDKTNDEIVDVEILNFKIHKMFLKMPVAIDAVAVGDVLIHNRKPCYVTGFEATTGNPIVIDVFMGERKEILLTKSPFGFNFVTKVVSILDNMNMTADAANPFGNMWMYMLMSEDNKVDDILPFLLINNENTSLFENPMMMYLLAKDGGNNMLPLMLMMSQNGK